MANEIKLQARFAVSNGNYVPGPVTINNAKFDQSAQGADDGIVSIGTSEQDLTINVTTLGWAFIRNLDATNYITYGPKSAGAMVAFGRLEPGEFAMLRLAPGVTIRAIANTAACDLWFWVLND